MDATLEELVGTLQRREHQADGGGGEEHGEALAVVVLPLTNGLALGGIFFRNLNDEDWGRVKAIMTGGAGRKMSWVPRSWAFAPL
jgi:hypothetical protein